MSSKNPDKIVVKCQKCGKKLQTQQRYIGRTAKCPSCKAVVRITQRADGSVLGREDREHKAQVREGGLLNIDKHEDVTIITFGKTQSLDQTNVQQFEEELDDVLEDRKLVKLLFNFHGITYISSIAIGKFVSLRKKVGKSGAILALCEIGPEIAEIFQVMKMDKFFDIYKTEEKAINALTG